MKTFLLEKHNQKSPSRPVRGFKKYLRTKDPTSAPRKCHSCGDHHPFNKDVTYCTKPGHQDTTPGNKDSFTGNLMTAIDQAMQEDSVKDRDLEKTLHNLKGYYVKKNADGDNRQSANNRSRNDNRSNRHRNIYNHQGSSARQAASSRAST